MFLAWGMPCYSAKRAPQPASKAGPRAIGTTTITVSPNQGMADTLDEAKAAFARRYEDVEAGEMMAHGSGWRQPLENVASARDSARRWSCWPAARMAPLRRCLRTATASAGRCSWASSVLGLRQRGEG